MEGGQIVVGVSPPAGASAARSGAAFDGAAGRPGRLGRQRRPAWVAGGVASVTLAVLANVYLFQNASHRSAVVQVVRDVPVGARISRADLGTASVALDDGVGSVPGRQLAQVVGRWAAVDLRRGTLLAASQVTTGLTPQPGQALVTTGVKASELPPRGLAPGSKVRLVPIPGQNAAAGAQSGAGQNGAGDGSQVQDSGGQSGGVAGKGVPAVVDAVGGPDADGSMTVSLLVADADSSNVARDAAAGRIALVVTAREG